MTIVHELLHLSVPNHSGLWRSLMRAILATTSGSMHSCGNWRRRNHLPSRRPVRHLPGPHRDGVAVFEEGVDQENDFTAGATDVHVGERVLMEASV